MMDDVRLIRRLVLFTSMAIAWGLIHVGSALMDEGDRIITTLFHESNFPWLPTKEEWPKRSLEERKQHWIRYREEIRQRFRRSFLLTFSGIIVMVWGVPATIILTEYLLSKTEDEP